MRPFILKLRMHLPEEDHTVQGGEGRKDIQEGLYIIGARSADFLRGYILGNGHQDIVVKEADIAIGAEGKQQKPQTKIDSPDS